MQFTVTYRGADGASVTEVVEAANRTDCFAQMKARGTVPTSVKEGGTRSGRNAASVSASRRPSTAPKRVSAKPKSIIGVLLVIVILAAVAGGIWWWLERGGVEPQPDTPSPKKTALAKEVKPSAAPKSVEDVPAQKDYANLDNITLRRLPESETNNLSDAQVKYWRMFHPYPPPDPNKQPKAKIGHYKIFKSRVDNEIAFLVATEPGTMVLGNRSVGPDFETRFLKSIETPIIVSEDDSEHDKALKRAVIAAKIELKQAYDRGEDIGKIMDDTRNEIQRLSRYKAQLEKEVLKVMNKTGTTASDAEDIISAMNKMLEERGIAPVELNAMSKIAMKYQSLSRKKEDTK